ncbi:MAG: hypothetical protein B6229_05360 [Spirochaetaceae bacterium 4572_7]|nr:MAG: hypothetical protein B6229_05360 [Spirochaetaceae bacterium 4572_7]
MSINEKEFNSLFMPKKNTVSQSQKNESKKENEIKEVNSEALTKLKTTLFKLKNNKQDVSLKELRDSKEKNS